MNERARGHDRRRHPRFVCSSPTLVVDHTGLTHHYSVVDVSAEGVRLSGRTQLPTGRLVRVLFQLPGREPFSLDGRVSRQTVEDDDDVAVAVEFHSPVSEAVDSREAEILGLMRVTDTSQMVALVVDESRRACAEVVRALSALGHGAVAVTTPLDAVEWLLANGTAFDVAFVDWRIGRGAGCGLMAFLAEDYPRVRRIVTLKRNDEALRRGQPEACQAQAVLRKPCKEEDVARALSQSTPREHRRVRREHRRVRRVTG